MITFASVIGILYLLLIIAMCVIALVVVYHIMKYSINKTHAFLGTFFFASVFLILAISNYTIFSRIDWTLFARLHLEQLIH
jgi:hypothetical protein